MCDVCCVCSDFLDLVVSYEARINNDAKHSILFKSEIETAYNYIQAWPQRQCMCLYRDVKNFERFNYVVQSIIFLCVHHMKHMGRLIADYKRLTASMLKVESGSSKTAAAAAASSSSTNTSDTSAPSADDASVTATENETEKSEDGNEKVKDLDATTARNEASDKDNLTGRYSPTDSQGNNSPPPPPPSMNLPSPETQHTEEPWILPEVEKLLLLVSKVFLLNFPLYIAYKHGTHARLDDISAEEAQHLAIYCDLHDNEIPVFLLRNITLFCNTGGFAAMMMCFEEPDLPVSIAHAITAAVSNIKLWLNYSCIVQLFVPLRSRVLQYMCKLSDQNLRTAQTRAMADFVWSAIRDPLDSTVSFDIEGLALAFKYFTSTTLTMRLAGMAQINAHINLFNEICTTETVGEVEIVGQKIGHWLTENQIIEHLFGPNLHVEVIKQAHVVLNFLAVENQITEGHIQLIWQATQLKHCSKTIFDILPSLVKNLAARPAMHLYSLICHMDPKDHTEQTIYIASALTKLIWTRDSSRVHLSMMQEHMLANTTASSSDSGSLDGSNSDDDHGNGDDSSIGSGGRKSPIDIENISSPPCKQARRRHIICDPTEEKSKLSPAELSFLTSKVDLKMQNHHRIVNIIDNSSTDEDDEDDLPTAHTLQLHRKKLRKRSKNAVPMTRLTHNIVAAIWDGSGASGAIEDDDEATSDEVDDVEADLLNDSDECSDGEGQDVPTAVLKHLQGEGPYIRAIAETHISELLSGAENEGSYSSPMSNKSEKNLADFDDEDISPCEEELARLPHGCHMPPAFAAAAAAMAAAQSAMAMQKTEANVAAAAAAVAAAAVATGNAQQSLEAMRQQASAAANSATAAAMLKCENAAGKIKSCDMDMDIKDMGKELAKNGAGNGSSASSAAGGGNGNIHATSQPSFKINDVCQPGNTLLWDLLQDDKIHLLGESLALETEKALATLLCFSMDRLLRMKFIEGCLQNLAANRSVIVCLRLLPKLFASFQQFRPSDTHQVTMWAERQHRMMYHFFNNIKYYAKQHAETQANKLNASNTEISSGGENNSESGRILYSHKTQVSVRLHFLSSIYSSLGSPKSFRLSLDQIDALWEWLAHDTECSDCYFSWLQSQAKGDDQHGLGIEALQHLYLKKLPELRPEDFSMVALGLFQQLCTLARMAIAQYEKHTDCVSSLSKNIVGMIHLWKIALRAHNTEVSLAAIQYINMFYMGQQLRLEKEFVTQCMDNLMQAATALEECTDDEHSMRRSVNALESIQRGLMLLNTHLETFRRRYAFHLRRWAIEGKDYGSHSNLKGEGAAQAIRIVLQPAGISEKSVLHMHAGDLIADLKAEISKWWENLQGITSVGQQAPVLGLLLSEGPLRIITQGQELTSDYDERSLGDAGFKDNQIVYVSLGGRSGARRKELNLEHPTMQPPPPKECLPTVLLLQPRYFEQLFCLMQTLGGMRPNPNNLQLHTKAQLLSRRVWDILAILPTNPQILETFKSLNADLKEIESIKSKAQPDITALAAKRSQIKQKLTDLLDPSNLQKFMYALHIVESLVLSGAYHQRAGSLACCGNNSYNGNVVPMEQVPRSSKCSKRAGSKRRNSNSTESVNSTKEGGTSGHDSQHESANSSSSPLKDNKTVSPSSSTISTKSPVAAFTQPLSIESEHSETCSSNGNGNGNGNDKENNPVKPTVYKRYKSNLSEQEIIKAAKDCQAAAAASTSNPKNVPESTSSVEQPKWSEVFIKCGGLKHLYEIFISGQLQQSLNAKDALNEWRHDCLALMLRILCLIGFEELQGDDIHVVISRPHSFMLELMDIVPCLRRLASILNDEAYQNYATYAATAPQQYQQYCHLRTGFWGRAQVVQFAMNILVSFVHASTEARALLWSKPEYCNWVLKFILEDPEPAVRREICAGLYRICLGNTQSYQVLLVPLLRKLISFLPVAEKMSSYPPQQHAAPQQYLFSDEGKEPYGQACRDYFWLLARLVDTLTPEMVKTPLVETCNDSIMGATPPSVDLERLCESVSESILTRDFFETRHGYQDDGLVGLINLMSNLIKHDPSFKFSSSYSLQFIDKIFDFLFDMPSPTNRQKPKCKSATSRAAAYDLLVEMCKGCTKNYSFLHVKLIAQHTPGPKQPYPWDYWPRDEGRSECGYVGLTNLGATCYMASCIQHLYMMPQARAAILNVPTTSALKHETTLQELQRMFAYLFESERKAYNPRSFCRVYQMDHMPLNTGEQKDMAEFFIDLVSKLEEMTPELKELVKRLFCGTLSNNVVSLDCGHVSRTAEEFYTVRCQVADMRNLQESLDEVTVKDTLEGDNMYTCSQCGKKVRAEKRACFKKLPQILCFNTMRYTFNMITMLKEKVNTHFSFPMRLNMSDYVEKTLMPHQYEEDREKRKKEKEKKASESFDEISDVENVDSQSLTNSIDEEIEECLEYELVGVTVHTGTADGGHYYSFIKERNNSNMQHDRWFLFNDAEVKPFDPSQIAAECFGGEMTSKTYDSVTEKYLDFSFEKTNSAYMLFYERRLPEHLKQHQNELLIIPPTQTSNDAEEENKTEVASKNTQNNVEPQHASSSAGSKISNNDTAPFIPRLSKDLEDWIWQDNRQFLQDRNIFEHTYFNFMWQICGHIPQTLISQMDVTCMAAKLSVSFFIETFIHAKEKPTMVPWMELLTKQFDANQEACEWFLMHMSVEPWWPVQVLIQCPNQMVRQMFQRLVIHVIQRLRSTHASLYLKIEYDDNDKELVGNASCVTRFIRSLVLLMEHGAKAHLRHLSEYFNLLFEFSRMGEEETLFLLRIGVIKSVADFYLGHKTQDCIDVGSDNEDSSDEALSVDKTRPASLDKMIALVANLVERSRGPDLRLRLSLKDFNAIAGGKGFPFLYQQIRDNINPHQTKHLIHALCRWDERLANQIITMLFASVAKHTELCSPFFKLLTLLTESQSGPTGLPCFSQLILQRVWDAAECCPQSALEWLAFQAPKNKIAHSWILQSADSWVEQFLLAYHNARVRNAAAYLLVALVPSQQFRANFRSHSLHKLTTMPNNVYRELNEDAQIILHNIINLLLRLLRPARTYADIGLHGTSKLTSYFSLLSYCMVSKTEKLMIGPYMRSLWELFHPRLSEPSVPTHHNKHALLAFWHHSIIDCPENALAVANCPDITRNIAFNYILADHDDAEVVNYNRGMLPAYYGLLRLCCEQSRSLTRQLAAHQNLQWAFKNITPHPTQYAAAVDELFRLMTLFATRHPDSSEPEKHDVSTFRRTTLSAYLTSLDARVSWSTLISALRTLVDNDEDRLLVIYNGGIEMCFDALHTLHSMHHEATACHVAGDLQELLGEMVLLLTTLRKSIRLDNPGPIVTKQQLEQQAQQLQLLHKQHQQHQQQQSQTQSQQQTAQQHQQKEKKLQQQMQQQQLHLQQLQQQHFLRQQQQQHQTGLVKGLPDAIKRLATLLNTYNSMDLCRLALEVLKELVRNTNLDVTSLLAPMLINCHLTVANAPNTIGPLGPYFPRRGMKNSWSSVSKGSPRPPRPMVQMCIPHGELLTRGLDVEYDAQVDAFYRPYHDFIDVLMRMAVNTNTLNDSLVRLSCLVAIEGAPLHFNLFPKFWVGIYNNKSTHKYAELLIDCPNLAEYVHTVLRDARISLRDQFIRTFLEIYYPKIANLLPIAPLLYTICYSMHSKEDLDDLCGDLFAIRVVAQCTGIPATVRKQLRGSLKALLYKSARNKEAADNELYANKKLKLEQKTEKEEDKQPAACSDEPHSPAKKIDKTTSESTINATTSLSSMKSTSKTDVKSLEVRSKSKDPEEGAEKAKTTDKNEVEKKGNEKETETETEETLTSSTQQLENISDSGSSGSQKNTAKKTADERLLEEYEKHIKVLLNVESYIKTILALMQKDESGGGVVVTTANCSSNNNDIPMEEDDDGSETATGVVGAVVAGSNTTAESGGKNSEEDASVSGVTGVRIANTEKAIETRMKNDGNCVASVTESKDTTDQSRTATKTTMDDGCRIQAVPDLPDSISDIKTKSENEDETLLDVMNCDDDDDDDDDDADNDNDNTECENNSKSADVNTSNTVATDAAITPQI